MTDEAKEVSRRVLGRALYFGGYTDTVPVSDDALWAGLLTALLPIVGGGDGLWAARQVLRLADEAAE
jgi:hypothetical protein